MRVDIFFGLRSDPSDSGIRPFKDVQIVVLRVPLVDVFLRQFPRQLKGCALIAAEVATSALRLSLVLLICSVSAWFFSSCSHSVGDGVMRYAGLLIELLVCRGIDGGKLAYGCCDRSVMLQWFASFLPSTWPQTPS